MANQDKVNYSDNVFMGDVNNISNQFDNNNRVTCPQCQASGNITTFTCKGTELNKFKCRNMYCEHCKIDGFSKICEQCKYQLDDEKTKKITEKRTRRIKEQNRKISERKKRIEKERIAEEKSVALRKKQNKNLIQRIFFLSFIHMLIIIWAVLTKKLGDSITQQTIFSYFGLVVSSVFTIFLWIVIWPSDRKKIDKIENSIFPKSAISYIISVILFIPLLYYFALTLLPSVLFYAIGIIGGILLAIALSS
jgi:membrane-associated HD superfamily phosphohydrolase